MNRARVLIALALPVLPIALVASRAAEGQTRHDTNAPIDFSAAQGQLDDKANRAILTGGVAVHQAEMSLFANRVTIAYTGQITDGSPQASRVDAAGGVRITRPDQTAQGDYAVYDLNKHLITMIGNVTLTQRANTVRGGRLSIDLDTGRATIDGSGVNAGAANGLQNSNGRVTGRFSVPKRDEPK